MPLGGAVSQRFDALPFVNIGNEVLSRFTITIDQNLRRIRFPAADSRSGILFRGQVYIRPIPNGVPERMSASPACDAELFLAGGLEGVYGGGAVGWEDARGEGDDREGGDRETQGRRVARLEAVEEGSGGRGGGEADPHKLA